MACSILAPVILLSWIGLDRLLEQEKEARLRAVQEMAKSIALRVDREISVAEAALRVAANSKAMRDADFSSLHEQMSKGARNSYSWTLLSDYQGRALMNTLVPFGTALPQATGVWAARTYDAQKLRVSNYFVGTLSQTATVSVDLPVPSHQGRRYVISQIFNAKHFGNVLDDQQLPASWIVGVFGTNGVTIARSVRAEEFVGKPGPPDLIAGVSQSETGVLRRRSREGIDIYDVFARSKLSGWAIVVGVPVAEIEGPARRAVLFAGAALLLVIAVGLAFAVLLARRLASAMTLISRAAGSLASGEVPPKVNTRVTEVDAVSTALHRAGLDLSKQAMLQQELQDKREAFLRQEQAARVQAEAQNKAKDEFLAMLGHELRNPLSAVSGAIAIMEVPAASPEQLVRARAIGRRQVDHLAKLVDDLLDVGRVIAGKIHLQLQPIDLAEVARRCVETQQTTHKDMHTWSLRIQSTWTHGDATRLEQVINNLLSNAVRYTAPGGRIEVDVRADDTYAVVQVRDNGRGIAADLLPRIFDLFVQGPATIDRAQGGLGLGLTLVRHLVDMHGGTVTATSEGEGRGSRFTVHLPRCEHSAAEGIAGTDALPATTPARVLVVEDNTDGREMLITVLAVNGIHTIGAENGEQALAILDRFEPDVALVDIGLPDMDGYQLAARIRANPATTHIPMIALTGYGSEQDRQRALQAGFSAHLVKPYTVQGLLQTIQPLLP